MYKWVKFSAQNVGHTINLRKDGRLCGTAIVQNELTAFLMLRRDFLSIQKSLLTEIQNNLWWKK